MSRLRFHRHFLRKDGADSRPLLQEQGFLTDCWTKCEKIPDHLHETAYIEGCLLNANGSNGIYILNQSVVLNNTVDYHFGGNAGIRIQGSRARIEGDHIARCSHGLEIADSGNTTTRLIPLSPSVAQRYFRV